VQHEPGLLVVGQFEIQADRRRDFLRGTLRLRCGANSQRNIGINPVPCALGKIAERRFANWHDEDKVLLRKVLPESGINVLHALGRRHQPGRGDVVPPRPLLFKHFIEGLVIPAWGSEIIRDEEYLPRSRQR